MPPHAPRTRLAAVALLLAGSGAVYYFTRPSPAPEAPPAAAPETRPDAPPAGPPWFRDSTEATGVRMTCRNGEEADQFAILESLGGGVALLDYDGDGRLDIFLIGGGTFDGPEKTDLRGNPCKLYRNLGGMRFEDATAAAGLDGPWWYTHGAAVADYDRDGFPDLLVTGYGRVALFHNEPGGPTGRRFVDASAKLGLRDDSWATSAGWGDLNGDGFPDLYVCHYVDWAFGKNHPVCAGVMPGVPRDVCPPQKFRPLVHSLFVNDRGTTFRDVAAAQGFRAAGCGLGVVLADVNDDGRPDVYVANDATNNFLFLNRTEKPGAALRLEEVGGRAGAAVDDTGRYNGSMGVDVGDYEGSGRPAVWVTNFQGELHALYHNLGGERFDHRSRAAGVAAAGMARVGFGTAFLDADGDGWEDVIVANGHVLRHPTAVAMKQTPVLLHNVASEGRRAFRDAAARGGPFFATPAIGRGLAVGDLDNDGRPDVVVSHTNAPAAVLHNEADIGTRWLGVRLVGRGNRDVAGSTITLEGEQRRPTRYAKGGGSYLSAGDPRILFGLGTVGAVKRVTVKWAWGATESWDNLDAGAYWTLHEGNPTASRTPPAP